MLVMRGKHTRTDTRDTGRVGSGQVRLGLGTGDWGLRNSGLHGRLSLGGKVWRRGAARAGYRCFSLFFSRFSGIEPNEHGFGFNSLFCTR